MSYCHNCDRFVAVPVTIQGKPYCCRCAVDYPDEDEYSHDDEITRRIDAVLSTAGDSHLGTKETGNLNSDEPKTTLGAKSEQRIGTCYIDPATGEHVMAGDFAGDRELRWSPDCQVSEPENMTLNEVCPNCGLDIDAAFCARDWDSLDLHYEYCGTGAPTPSHHSHSSVPLAEQIAQYGDRCEEVLDALHTNLEDEWFRTEVIRLGAQRLIENYGECIDRMYHWSADVRDKNMMEEAADYVCYGTSGPFFNTRSATDRAGEPPWPEEYDA